MKVPGCVCTSPPIALFLPSSFPLLKKHVPVTLSVSRMICSVDADSEAISDGSKREKATRLCISGIECILATFPAVLITEYSIFFRAGAAEEREMEIRGPRGPDPSNNSSL